MTVAERVLDVVHSVVGGTLKPDSNLKEDCGVDSLDAVEIVIELEEEFDLDISEGDAEKWTTIQDIINFLEDKGFE